MGMERFYHKEAEELVQPYKHEPFTDFSNDQEREGYLLGLQTVEGYLGQDYDLIIGGE